MNAPRGGEENGRSVYPELVAFTSQDARIVCMISAEYDVVRFAVRRSLRVAAFFFFFFFFFSKGALHTIFTVHFLHSSSRFLASASFRSATFLSHAFISPAVATPGMSSPTYLAVDVAFFSCSRSLSSEWP